MRPIDADALKQDLLKKGFYPVIVKCALEDAPTIEQPTWISVDDRLPPYNERVLAYVCGRIEPLTLFYRDLLVEDYWEDDVQRVIILRAVTHWMPLPQPPKGVEDTDE